jgi:hypothetical protein
VGTCSQGTLYLTLSQQFIYLMPPVFDSSVDVLHSFLPLGFHNCLAKKKHSLNMGWISRNNTSAEKLMIIQSHINILKWKDWAHYFLLKMSQTMQQIFINLPCYYLLATLDLQFTSYVYNQLSLPGIFTDILDPRCWDLWFMVRKKYNKECFIVHWCLLRI